MATSARMAVKPGVPTNPSICWQMNWPWSPPGLKCDSANSGAKNLASVTAPQTMITARAKNHFNSFTLYAFIMWSDVMSSSSGMIKAVMPKQRLIKYHDR